MTEDRMDAEHISLLKFLYACPVGLLEMESDGQITMMNPYAMQLLLPLAPARAVQNFFTIMENWAPELRNMTEIYTRRQGSVCDSHRIVVSPGTREDDYSAKVLACTIVKLDGSRLAVTVADVSSEVARERRLKHAEVWFSSLMDDINDFAVLSVNGEGVVEEINPSTTRQTGYTADDLVGRIPECLDLCDPGANVITIREQLASACRDGWQLSEGWQKKKNGERYWCQRLIAVKSDVENASGRTVLGFLVVLRHVSRGRADASQLAELLRKDHLTGACNRSHFFSVAERECIRAKQTGQPLSLIAVDLDHFKKVNDTYGHAAGDDVLRMFTGVTKDLLRPVDTFARLGGEEFSILLPNTTLSEAVHVAERLRESLAHRTVQPYNLSVTASFGCAEMSDNAATSRELLAVADQAMYTAKRNGRDRTEPSLFTLAEQACLG